MDSQSPTGMESPIAGMEPPKSKKKLWIFGGLGCLGVIGLMCVGMVFAGYYYFYKPMEDFQRNTVNEALAMPRVEEILGSPITTGTPAPPVQEDSQTFVFKTPLSGPDGEATLVVKGQLNPNDLTWNKEDLYLEVDGERVDLDTEELFDIEISDGQ